MAQTKQSDLIIITKAKDLCSYALTVTQKLSKRRGLLAWLKGMQAQCTSQVSILLF
jgi:hypothetical protein